MKTITTKLKKTPEIHVQMEDVFKKYNWIEGSAIIENTKRKMLAEMKSKLHEQISVLALDDLDFFIN